MNVINNLSNFNLQKINTEELATNIAGTIEFGGNLFAVARRGTGKTSICSAVISQLGYKEIYFNLALMERPDLGGYPNFFNSKEKYVSFLMPSIYKPLMEGNDKCVALLDEIDKAEPGLTAPLLEFVQKKSINGIPLRNLQATIMTGNLPNEGGQRPVLPLLDRTEKYLVEVNVEHWLKWGATSKEIHPSISAYISEYNNELVGDVDPGEVFADASPRGWHNASKIIMYGERTGWHPKLMMQKVSGCVGKKSGIKYMTFYEHYIELLPLATKILAGEELNNNTWNFDNLEPTKKLVLTMSACSKYAKLLDDNIAKTNKNHISLDANTIKIGKNLVKYLKSNIDPEMALICIRSQIGSDRLLTCNLLNDNIWGPLLESFIARI